MKYIFFSFLTFLLLSACNNKKQADEIFHHGIVYTVDSTFSKAEAFVVKAGKIVAVGSNEEILQHYDAAKKTDLQGHFVYPGFIDAHCHFVGYAMDMKKAHLFGTKSFAEIIEQMKEFATHTPETWLYGRGWNQNDWEKKDFPDKSALDKAFPDRPVFLKRIDGHAAIANQKALDLAGVTKDTKVRTGYVEVKEGKLTGILLDDAMTLVERKIPLMPEDTLHKYMLKAQKDCIELGLTTLDDAGLDKRYIDFLDKLQKNNELKLRIYAMLTPTQENFEAFLHKKPYKTDRLNVRSFKIYSDGALGSYGACLLHPYHDKPDQRGFLLHDVEYFDSIAAAIYPTDFQICTHAIGDSANRLILQTYQKYLKGKNDRRWRIEHAQIVDRSDLYRWGQYSIIPSVQPTHFTSDISWAETRLDDKRLKGAYIYKELMEQNGWIPLGTDFPVEYLNPLYTFYSAVERSKFGNQYFNNSLTREQALRGMTIWAAKSNFEEKEKGSIEPNKFADFVIMKDDLMKDDLPKIREAKVVATYINGEKLK
ncbi:MAG: amidohydrolase [Bacteroidia bacterium]